MFNCFLDAVTYGDFKRQTGHVNTDKVCEYKPLAEGNFCDEHGKAKRSATAEDHMGYATKGSELATEHRSVSRWHIS
jgi:hypothetical protein